MSGRGSFCLSDYVDGFFLKVERETIAHYLYINTTAPRIEELYNLPIPLWLQLCALLLFTFVPEWVFLV
jgi:hypothetical protein